MKRDGTSPDPHSKASRLGFVVLVIVLAAGLVTTYAVARATNYHLLGICGPTGSGWVDMIFLSSFPVSIAAGVIAARLANRRWNRAGKQEPDPDKPPAGKQL